MTEWPCRRIERNARRIATLVESFARGGVFLRSIIDDEAESANKTAAAMCL